MVYPALTHLEKIGHSQGEAQGTRKLYRITKAGDDAAGLAISQRLDAQVNGLNQAQRNAQDGISLVQTAEGALNESQSILQRMRELVVQAGTATVSPTDRTAMQLEVTSLQNELDRIGNTTQYNGQNLLDGSFGATASTTATIANGITSVQNQGAPAATYALTVAAGTHSGLKITVSVGGTQQSVVDDFAAPAAGLTKTINFSDGISVQFNQNMSVANTNGQTVVVAGTAANLLVGANGTAAEQIAVSIGDNRSAALGVNTLDVSAAGFNVTTATASMDAAINQISNSRAGLGAIQNRLEPRTCPRPSPGSRTSTSPPKWSTSPRHRSCSKLARRSSPRPTPLRRTSSPCSASSVSGSTTGRATD